MMPRALIAALLLLTVTSALADDRAGRRQRIARAWYHGELSDARLARLIYLGARYPRYASDVEAIWREAVRLLDDDLAAGRSCPAPSATLLYRAALFDRYHHPESTRLVSIARRCKAQAVAALDRLTSVPERGGFLTACASLGSLRCRDQIRVRVLRALQTPALDGLSARALCAEAAALLVTAPDAAATRALFARVERGKLPGHPLASCLRHNLVPLLPRSAR